MKRWLIPIMAVLMLLCFAIAFLPLTQREEANAKDDLTELTDAAFERIAASQASAGPVAEAEEAALTEKGRAVARFLAHDDALLATGALNALCSQLAIDRIDVADDQGNVIASSDGARIGLALGSQEGFEWTMDALDDQETSQADETDAGVLYCSVPRTDIEGFVFLTRDDPYLEQALSTDGTESIIADLAYGGDLLFVAEPGGTDGFFYDSGSLCLRRTQDGVTLIAARENSVIYQARTTALIALAAMLVCVMICIVAAYLLHLEFAAPDFDERPEPDETEERDRRRRIAALPEPEKETEAEEGGERPRERAKRPKERSDEPAAEKKEPGAKKKRVPEKETEETREEKAQRRRESAQAPENAPRQPERKRPRPKQKPPEPPKDVEEPFDKIVD